MTLAVESDFLQSMALASRERDRAARSVLSEAQQLSQLPGAQPVIPLRLRARGFDVIAEIKKRSPAEGQLDTGLASPAQQALAYASGGAAVLSVLTEPAQFRGSLDDLHTVSRSAPTVPIMRKDFLVSRYQIREARLAGASGVLLIAGILELDQLKAMLEAAFELDMFALVEVFDQHDLERCLPVLEAMGPARQGNHVRMLLGVNCRDLRTLKVNFTHFARMAGELPEAIDWVAESGVTEVEQAGELAGLGYRLALVGTTLMRSEDPQGLVESLRASGAKQCL